MDLSLRILADATSCGSRFRPERCGNCGAPWERCCSFCGRNYVDEMVPVSPDLRHAPESVLTWREIERMCRPLPEPTNGTERGT